MMVSTSEHPTETLLLQSFFQTELVYASLKTLIARLQANSLLTHILRGSWVFGSAVSNCVVRFPNSHGCELGERRACTRGIFLPWQIVAKIFIESGQLRTELACSTRELALSHWPTPHKCTECGCGTAFLSPSSLPLVPGRSMRKCKFTCRAGQFCAELSTFNENFCHNLPWKKNSPGTGPSFSQFTTKWVGEPD